MKSQWFLLFILTTSSLFSLLGYDPLLVVVLMVKNEGHVGTHEPVIIETLRPFYEGGVRSFFVFDTGSTDNTIEIAREFFRDNELQGFIAQEAFIDFGTSRNRALELARQAFPSACFMIMPDAEWHIHNVPTLLNFCQAHQNEMHPSYLIKLSMGGILFYRQLLIRCSSCSHFEGEIHEALLPVCFERIPESVYFEVRAGEVGQEKSKLRWQRDLAVLIKKHEHDPADARTVYYLAQTLHWLERYEEALTYYEKRITLGGWDEERFEALCNCSYIHETINSPWRTALGYYMQAIACKPDRAEPLISLAEHYLEVNEPAVAFLFALRACELDYPSNDLLTLNPYLYDVTRWDVLSQCAWYTGHYSVGEYAVQQALEHEPNEHYLKDNLELFQERIASYATGQPKDCNL